MYLGQLVRDESLNSISETVSNLGNVKIGRIVNVLLEVIGLGEKRGEGGELGVRR